MAMLYLSDPLPTVDLDSWILPTAEHDKVRCLDILSRLHIITSSGTPAAIRLTNSFAASLRLALTGGGTHQSFGVPSDAPDSHPVDITFLDSFARAQWESILHYMVGSIGLGESSDLTHAPSPSVASLLRMGDLVENRGTTHRPSISITQTGFSFLLQEVNAQVWTLMIFYLEACDGLGMDPVEVLSFLFMLGSLTLGQSYSLATLTETQILLLDDLTDFGIVYRRKSTSDRFYPTRLATTLTSDASALRSLPSTLASLSIGAQPSSSVSINSNSSGPARGFIIIETNYRLYAYTSSPLQIAVLALFVRLHTRYPNMVSGRITRDSIQRAVSHGITSDQIIDYLQTHAHPQMHRRLPVLPPTVVDQIRLWQLEGERMKATSGFLFKDFDNHQAWEETSTYAEEIGVLVWRSESRRAFFVNRIEGVAAFLRGRAKKEREKEALLENGAKKREGGKKAERKRRAEEDEEEEVGER